MEQTKPSEHKVGLINYNRNGKDYYWFMIITIRYLSMHRRRKFYQLFKLIVNYLTASIGFLLYGILSSLKMFKKILQYYAVTKR